MPSTIQKQYKSVSEFYPFYLTQHSNRTCRRLHFVGTALGSLQLAVGVFTFQPMFLLTGIITGYAFAWIGHFFFEKNKPATFKYPLYSFICDYKMVGDILAGNIAF